MRARLTALLAAWTEEAFVALEQRRCGRILTQVRIPLLYSLVVFLIPVFMLPLLGSESRGMAAMFGLRLRPDSWLGIMLHVAAVGAAVGGFLRAQQFWNQERSAGALTSWILSRVSPQRSANTALIAAAILGGLQVAAPTLLASLIAAAVNLTALPGRQSYEWLHILWLIPVHAWLGAALGTLIFLAGVGLVPRSRISVIVGVVALVIVGVLIRIEFVEGGFRGVWEDHPGRILRAAFLVSPMPSVLGALDPSWLAGLTRRSLGVAIRPGWMVMISSGVLLFTGWMIHAAAMAGIRRLATEPSWLEPRRRSRSEAPGEEFYWAGFRNPVLTRELRTRLRSSETAEFVMFTSVAVAAAAFVPLLLASRDLSDPLQTAATARQVFFWLSMTLVALVTLITPGITAHTLVQERADGSLELLVASPLRAPSILVGKATGAIAVMMLMTSPSLPLFGLCYLFHGASLDQVLSIYLLLIVTITLAAVVGVTQSSIHTRGGVAKFWAYGVTAGLVAIPGGPIWVTAAFSAPEAGVRQALLSSAPVAVLIGVLAGFILVLMWGNACEQLQYTEF